MLEHRDYEAGQRDRFVRYASHFAEALAVVVVPILRLVGWLFPPVRRAMSRTTGGFQGEVFRNRDSGDHRAAFAAALGGMALQERRGAFRDGNDGNMAAFQWWTFLDLAAKEAQHLGTPAREQVIELIGRTPAPGGMFAASVLRTVAGWRWDAGEKEAAISLARRAVLADPSWAHGHVFLGWVGLITGRHDPLPHLREALRVDPSCARQITANPAFAAAPDLLRSLGL